ncbi:MAG: ring-cleaving dioxygenase [Gemmatimonadetes bacterium]|nr:ring-cleaving dioxygenase [Gemmatimonadota bacterium]
MTGIKGIHHVTSIAGDPQENVDFYVGVLGMRLVKRSVNQDDPGTYHLFYADAEGHPGSDLTFFPWRHMPAGQDGVGLTVEVALAVAPGALEFWSAHLGQHGVPVGEPHVRFGEKALPFGDPHGLSLTLVETADRRDFTPWRRSPVPEASQIRGIHGIRLWERNLAATGEFLTRVLGFAALGREGAWHRFGLAGAASGGLVEVRELPAERRGTWGVGSVHHVAWRVTDERDELAIRERVQAAGQRPTGVIDRFWFKSVYFKEPGGALFELATDGPGFSVDEDPATLGEHLVLPPWLEPDRRAIEAALPPLRSGASVPG